MVFLSDSDVRDILKPHRDGGPISRLYACGEITDETIPALGVLAACLDMAGASTAAEALFSVVRYARDAGVRPPVRGWVGKLL